MPVTRKKAPSTHPPVRSSRRAASRRGAKPSPPTVPSEVPSKKSSFLVLHESACICNDYKGDNPMCSVHTYTRNRSAGDKIDDIDGDDDEEDEDVVIQSKTDKIDESKEEGKHDYDNDIDDHASEETKNNHNDDFEVNNNADEDYDDIDDGNYVPNANKELDFSDDEEFLAELSDCSDEVIVVKSKEKGVKKAKGGTQHYRNGPKPPDTSRMTEAQAEAAMNNFLRERKKWTKNAKKVTDGPQPTHTTERACKGLHSVQGDPE